eukprot:TRINITY_DN3111_c0_g1_i2.p2 TRINITY_DN3111_c0_g1~~TRINITY_DN3111_c0_g1_i2.p2  ORF type:complete len:117 (+),score=45.72 TRINITY_DN3111_c0_g1_i2:63-413(+)
MCIRDRQEQQQAGQEKESEQEETKQQQQSKGGKGDNKGAKNGAQKQSSEKLKKGVSEEVLDELLNSKQPPQNASVFEKESQILKSESKNYYLYLKKIPIDHFKNCLLYTSPSPRDS